jgi:hypothetical protein
VTVTPNHTRTRPTAPPRHPAETRRTQCASTHTSAGPTCLSADSLPTSRVCISAGTSLVQLAEVCKIRSLPSQSQHCRAAHGRHNGGANASQRHGPGGVFGGEGEGGERVHDEVHPEHLRRRRRPAGSRDFQGYVTPRYPRRGRAGPPPSARGGMSTANSCSVEAGESATGNGWADALHSGPCSASLPLHHLCAERLWASTRRPDPRQPEPRHPTPRARGPGWR